MAGQAAHRESQSNSHRRGTGMSLLARLLCVGAAASAVVAGLALPSAAAAAGHREKPFAPYNTLEELRDAVRLRERGNGHGHLLQERQASASVSGTKTATGTLVTITAAPTTTKSAVSTRPPITPPPGVAPLPGTYLTRKDQGVYHRFNFQDAPLHRFYLDLKDLNYPCAENELQIADQGCSGDEYNVWLDGVLVGRTTVSDGGKCEFKNIVPGAYLDQDIDLKAKPDFPIFPGIAWDIAWSSGRFVIPDGFHVLEVELYKKGDGTYGAFNFYQAAWGCRQQDISGAVTKEWHSNISPLNQDLYVWPNIPGLVWDVNVPSGSCMNLTIWDSICPGDQWNVYVDGKPAGTSSEPKVECCRFWLQNEGSREYPNFKMGWDWWDIIMPSYGGDRFSTHTIWIPEGQHQVTFDDIGHGDGRTAYIYGKLDACPAGYEAGKFKTVAFTKTAPATRTLSVWPQQTSCAIGTGDENPAQISVVTVPTRSYETWGVTPTSEPKVKRAMIAEPEAEGKGWFSWLW